MNIPTDILEFIQRWQDKTNHYSNDSLADVFDHFFSAFVLYNFLYREVTTREEYTYTGDKDQATKTIKRYLGADTIFNDLIIQENATTIKKLISNGTFYIRDSVWDLHKIDKLSSTDAETWSKGILEVIYQIRCNTFHGEKRFTENQKIILIPCIKITEQINSMVAEKMKA